jgi:hypothetical protein
MNNTLQAKTEKQKYNEIRKQKNKPLSMNDSMFNKIVKESISSKVNKIKVNKVNNKTNESCDKENREELLRNTKSKFNNNNNIPVPNKTLSKE